MKINQKKSRNISLISYLSSVDDVQSCINAKLNQIRGYAYIWHNKDTDENGVLKTPHFHIALKLKTSRDLGEVRRWFEKDGANCLAQVTLSNSAIVDYFCHKDEPAKYQYDKDCIYSNNLNDFVSDDNNCISVSLVDDILAGKSFRYLLQTYGKEFVYHYNQYRSIATLISLEDACQRVDNLDRLECIDDDLIQVSLFDD